MLLAVRVKVDRSPGDRDRRRDAGRSVKVNGQRATVDCDRDDARRLAESDLLAARAGVEVERTDVDVGELESVGRRAAVGGDAPGQGRIQMNVKDEIAAAEDAEGCIALGDLQLPTGLVEIDLWFRA